MKKFLVAVSVLLGIGVAFAADPAKVALVEKGELKEAKASWWGFDPADSTKFLQAAINSKVPRLIIDKQATPWISKALFGVSNQTLVFEDGTELQALKGDFKNTGYGSQLIRWDDAENVKVIGLGKGGTLRMHKKDYHNPKIYRKSEHRHTLAFMTSKNIYVENMTLASSGGDGIYLNKVENVHIKNVICDDHNRQGMSIISCDNVLAENCQFINTWGTSPESGVDIEPNKAEEKVRNIVFRNCRFANNNRWGMLIAVAHINSSVAGTLGVKFENCVFENNEEGEFYLFLRSIFHTDYPVLAKIDLIDCIVRSSRNCKMLRPAIEFSMDLHHQAEINVKNLTVTRGSNKENAMRIAFHYPNKANAKPQAKIKLDNVKFTDCNIREALEVMDNGLTGANDYISGTVIDKKGKTHPVNARLLKRAGVKAEPEFDYDYSECTAKVATPANGEMEAYPEFPLWQYATYWFYAQKDQEVKFELKFYKKIRFAKTTAVNLITPEGKESKLGEISPDEVKTFSFKAGAAGFYKVDMRNKDLRVALLKSNAPAGIVLNKYTHRFSRNSGTLFFNVPANSAEFAVRVWGQIFSNNYYAVKAVVCDPDGKVVFSDSAIGGAVQYNPKKSEIKPGIWKVSFAWPQGGQYKLGEYNLRLMGVSPYVGLREDRTPVLSGKVAKVVYNR